jgi:hypothetical protein
MSSEGRLRFLQRYPRVVGIFLLVVGVWMTLHCIQSGKAMARFAGGAIAEGRVVGVENAGSGIPDYRMSVAWTDASGAEQTATTNIYKDDFERSKAGDAIQLLTANDDPGSVMLKKIYDDQGLVSLGFAHATPLVFFGLLAFLCGVFLLVTGNRFLGQDD